MLLQIRGTKFFGLHNTRHILTFKFAKTPVFPFIPGGHIIARPYFPATILHASTNTQLQWSEHDCDHHARQKGGFEWFGRTPPNSDLARFVELFKSFQPEVKASKLVKRFKSYGH